MSSSSSEDNFGIFPSNADNMHMLPDCPYPDMEAASFSTFLQNHFHNDRMNFIDENSQHTSLCESNSHRSSEISLMRSLRLQGSGNDHQSFESSSGSTSGINMTCSDLEVDASPESTENLMPKSFKSCLSEVPLLINTQLPGSENDGWLSFESSASGIFTHTHKLLCSDLEADAFPESTKNPETSSQEDLSGSSFCSAKVSTLSQSPSVDYFNTEIRNLLSCESALSWENKEKSPVPICHYVSEAGHNDVVPLTRNMTEILHFGELKKSVIICASDVKNLLIGISSVSFNIPMNSDSESCVTPIDSLSYLTNTSHTLCLFDICKTVLKAHNLCQTFRQAESTVTRSIASAIEEFLYCYETNVLSVKIDDDNPIDSYIHVFFGIRIMLRDFVETCDMLSSFCSSFKDQKYGNNIMLLSTIYKIVQLDSNGTSCAGINLLLKHCLLPYFGFLQHSLFEDSAHEISLEFLVKGEGIHVMTTDEEFTEKYIKDSLTEDLLPVFFTDIKNQVIEFRKFYNFLRMCSPSNILFSNRIPTPEFGVAFSHKRIAEFERNNLKVMLMRCDIIFKDFRKQNEEYSITMNQLHGCWLEIISSVVMNEQLEKHILTLIPDQNRLEDLEVTENDMPIAQLSKYVILTMEDLLEAVEDGGDIEIGNFGEPNYEWLHNFPSDDPLVNRLIVKICECLNDGCGDVRDVVNFVNEGYTIEAINKLINPVAQAQIELVNRCILQHLFVDRELYTYFEEMTDIFFLREPNFRSKLCKSIYDVVRKVHTADYFFSLKCLHSILVEALPNKCDVYHGAFILQAKNSSRTFPLCELSVVEHLHLTYSVEFPCNLVITERHVEDYNRVLWFIIQLQLPLSRMQDLWFDFRSAEAIKYRTSKSIQFTVVMLIRNEMFHFVHVLHSYIGHRILSEEWTNFLKSVKENVKNMDDLRHAHETYISDALKICLLHPRQRPILALLQKLLKYILLFSKYLTDYDWSYDAVSRQWKHAKYKHMIKVFRLYQDKEEVFWMIVLDLVHKNLFPHWESLSLCFNY